ncbi:MAG: hypothetical protein ACE5IY_03530 [bacterium]
MNCPYFFEARCNQCLIFKGLFVPSIYEEKNYCRNGKYQECGIFTLYAESSIKVSKEEYRTQIEREQYSGPAVSSH